MAELEYYVGCVGCVDFALNNKSCDYLLNNGHCRPCKADKNGCELYTKRPRLEDETEEERRTWDTEKARRLLAGGMPVIKAVDKLGASANSLWVWIKGGMPARTVTERRKRNPKGAWDEEVYRKLYEKGLTDPEAAERMGLDPQTVWKHRRRLGLPANGLKKRG